MLKRRRESILDIYTLTLGIVLFTLLWLSKSTYGAVRDEDLGSSALIASLSIAALIAFAEWEEWGKLILGLWLTASPWALGFAHTTAAHISIVVGILVAYLAGIEIWLIRHSGPTAS
jgi:uncharacterized membrane protein (DUF441 family)